MTRHWKNVAGLLGLAILGVSTFVVVRNALAAPPPKPPKTKIDTPLISCNGSTQVSINIKVCAPSGTGATGLPAGFTIQWMTAADFALGADGIPGTGDDNTWGTTPSYCGGSFSGNASGSRYNLAAGECVSVNIGELLFDNGASTSCPDALVCGTEYVFRAFGHATSTLMRSDFTGTLSCFTLPCGSPGDGCTLTQGYWKTHGPEGCATGNNINVWPVTSLSLGTVEYTDVQLCSILNTPAGGNGLIALAHQLIAAKLNIENGADGTDAAGCIAAADALIGDLVVPPVGSGSIAPKFTDDLVTCLTNYNEGATGPGHCDD
jgi:hypothetical protein